MEIFLGRCQRQCRMPWGLKKQRDEQKITPLSNTLWNLEDRHKSPPNHGKGERNPIFIEHQNIEVAKQIDGRRHIQSDAQQGEANNLAKSIKGYLGDVQTIIIQNIFQKIESRKTHPGFEEYPVNPHKAFRGVGNGIVGLRLTMMELGINIILINEHTHGLNVQIGVYRPNVRNPSARHIQKRKRR